MNGATMSPTPWRCLEDRYSGELHYQVVDAYNAPIFDSVNRSPAAALGNAERIDLQVAAAGPEMLELLREVQSGAYDGDPVAHANWLARVDAAISKASGEAA